MVEGENKKEGGKREKEGGEGMEKEKESNSEVRKERRVFLKGQLTWLIPGS